MLQGLMTVIASFAARMDVHQDAVAALDCGRQEPAMH